MLILVSGGSASGKSEFAEGLVTASGLETRAYLATMQVWDAESERRVERHRRMRAGKGFATVECPVNLAGAVLPAGCAALCLLLLMEWSQISNPQLYRKRPTFRMEKFQPKNSPIFGPQKYTKSDRPPVQQKIILKYSATVLTTSSTKNCIRGFKLSQE